jgi:putative membrane protein
MFSPDEKERIAAAIGAAEARGSCQIEVAAVQRSEDYAGPRATSSGLLALMLALPLVYGTHLGPYAAVIVALLIAAVAYAVLGTGPLVRLFLPAAQAEIPVRRQAHALFAEQLMARTGAPRVVLVFISRLEQRALVVVERRPGEVPGPWASVAAELQRALRAGRLADGMVAALERIGAELAPKQPPA